MATCVDDTVSLIHSFTLSQLGKAAIRPGFFEKLLETFEDINPSILVCHQRRSLFMRALFGPQPERDRMNGVWADCMQELIEYYNDMENSHNDELNAGNFWKVLEFCRPRVTATTSLAQLVFVYSTIAFVSPLISMS